MTVPSKNRVNDYEAGWLTLLVSMGIATKRQAEAAMLRVAQQAIEEIIERREQRRAERKRKKERD